MIKYCFNQCKTTVLILLSLFLIACGGGGGSSGGNSDTVTMIIDTSYTLSAGDTVLPTNTSARFDIKKKSNENISTVTLLTGSATIKRG